MQNLDDILHKFEGIHCRVPDKQKLYSWLFEYACQTAEYENKNPVKVHQYLRFLAANKLNNIYEACEKIYFETGCTQMELEPMKKKWIPKIIKKEHKE